MSAYSASAAVPTAFPNQLVPYTQQSQPHNGLIHIPLPLRAPEETSHDIKETHWEASFPGSRWRNSHKAIRPVLEPFPGWVTQPFPGSPSKVGLGVHTSKGLKLRHLTTPPACPQQVLRLALWAFANHGCRFR